MAEKPYTYLAAIWARLAYREKLIISLIAIGLLSIAVFWEDFTRFRNDPGLFYRNMDRAQDGLISDVQDSLNTFTGASDIIEDLRLDNVDLSAENDKLRRIVVILDRRLLAARAKLRRIERTEKRLQRKVERLGN